ncbi:MAG: hypothetical protein ABI859_03710 [Pseudomonadota bacterium]
MTTRARGARGSFVADIALRLLRREHLTLWGPQGSGKTTVLNEVQQLLQDERCGFSASTVHLDDITCALERAYGDVITQGLSRSAARGRLWLAADAEPGVLLLDQVSDVSIAMKSWLRRLRGGVAGVILAVDVNSPRERTKLRARRLGFSSVPMPRTAALAIARQLATHLAAAGVPPLPLPARRTLVRAARGRPGWVVTCASLAGHSRYWRDGQLKAHLLATDSEVCLRAEVAPVRDRQEKNDPDQNCDERRPERVSCRRANASRCCH